MAIKKPPVSEKQLHRFPCWNGDSEIWKQRYIAFLQTSMKSQWMLDIVKEFYKLW